MEYEFKDEKTYRKLLTDARFGAGFPPHVVTKFRRRMQQVVAAQSEKDFHALKSLRFEKLRGDRAPQWSMRLNDQWRLVIELKENEGRKVICIVGIEDYHT